MALWVLFCGEILRARYFQFGNTLPRGFCRAEYFIPAIKLLGFLMIVCAPAHLKIFTRGHAQLPLCGGEEVLREEEVKD